MGVVDPDRAVDETTEFRLTGPRFELHHQPVSRRPPAARHGVERTGRRRMSVSVTFVRGVRLALRGFERTGVRVAKIFEEVLKVDPRFTHGDILAGDDELSLRSRAARPQLA